MRLETQAGNQLMKLNIDCIKPRQATCIWAVFFFSIALLYILTLAIPDAILIKANSFYTKCNSNSSLINPVVCSPFDLSDKIPAYPILLDKLDEKNQFFTVDMTLVKSSSSGYYNTAFSIPVNYTLVITSFDMRSFTIGDAIVQNSTHNVQVDCSTTGSPYCAAKTIVYEPVIRYHGYFIQVAFTNAANYTDKIIDIQMQVSSVNPKYTAFLIALRYVCLGLSLMVLLCYINQLRKIGKSAMVFEQKYILCLAMLVIIFNDPFFALTILMPNMASAFFTCLFAITFLSALFLFWMATFERIYKENQDKNTRILTAPKWIYIFTLWLFLLVTVSLLSYNYLQDPGFDFDDEHNTTFMAFKFILIVLLIIGLGWLLNSTVYICRNFQTRMWRHKMFFTFSLYFIICYFIMVFTGSMSVYNLDGSRVLLLIGILNIYIWFLQYLYAPNAQGIKEYQSNQTLEHRREAVANYDVLDESDQDIQIEFQQPPGEHNQNYEDENNFQIGGDDYNTGTPQNPEHMTNEMRAAERTPGDEESYESADHPKGKKINLHVDDAPAQGSESSRDEGGLDIGNYDDSGFKGH
jgi:hypothetical protein